ncbi:HRDC domain-containing protein, partial [Streptomyces venezuelae]|uniref:HRDC domain-containing protein n=1 Tax=Streptomyces venezuelae TaxID=54571 RepID=UPI00278BF755
GVPAYVVFHDATLREIATRLPGTVEELGTVGGVGEAKLTKYAEGVLGALAEAGADAPAAATGAAQAPGAGASADGVAVPGARPAPADPAAAPYDEEPPYDLDELDEPPFDDWR